MSTNILDYLVSTKPTIKKDITKKIKKTYVIDFLREERLIDLLEYEILKDEIEINPELDTISFLNNQYICDILNRVHPHLLKDNKEFLIKSFTNIHEKFYKFDTSGTSIGFSMDIVGIVEDFKKKRSLFHPTEQQENAITLLTEFIVSTKSSFGLYGYAGTGKTTTLIEFVAYLLENRHITSVALTAPTNKALGVMKNKFKYYLFDILKAYGLIKVKRHKEEKSDSESVFSTDEDEHTEDDGEEETFDTLLEKLNNLARIKINFITVHKLLGFKNEFDFDTKEMIFNKSEDENIIKDFDLIIIDECSMISYDMITDIFKELKKNNMLNGDNLKKTIKVIFSGDPAQLPPVNEKKSHIFERELDGITLNKIVRNSNIKVIEACFNIREWIEDKVEYPTLYKYASKHSSRDIESGEYFGAGIYLYKNKGKKPKLETDWFKTAVKYFKDSEKENSTTSNVSNIIIAWTNRQCDEYNLEIRKNTRDFSESVAEFMPNDVLILTDFYNIGTSKKTKKEMKEAKKEIFHTSEQIRVVSCSEEMCEPMEFNENIHNVLRKLKAGIHIQSKYKKFIENLTKRTVRTFLVWKLKVVRLRDISAGKKSKKVNMTEITVLNKKDISKLEKERDYVFDEIQNFKKKNPF